MKAFLCAALILSTALAHAQVLQNNILVPSAKPQSQSLDRVSIARGVIGADGHVVSLHWVEHNPIEKLLSARLDPVVRQWRFVPGQINGQPAITETAVYVEVLGYARPDESIGLRIVKAFTGPSMNYSSVPTAAILSMEGVTQPGTIRLIVAIDRKGIGSIESYTFDDNVAEQTSFYRGARTIVRQSKFAPEIVGGQPLPARVAFPITFCAYEQEVCERPALADEDSSSIETVVRLTTDVAAGPEI